MVRMIHIEIKLLGLKPKTDQLTEVSINISKLTLTTRLSHHPSVPTCSRVLLAGILHPVP